MKHGIKLSPKTKRMLEQNAWMIGGNVLFAAAVNIIITPFGLYNGGFMGIAQLLRLFCVNVLHMPVKPGFDLVGVIYFVENVPLFLLAYRVVGKKFTVRTLFSTIVASLSLALVPVFHTPIIHDRLTACLVGGVLAGTGAGMVMRSGCSGGGQDIIGITLSIRHPNTKVGVINIFVNAFIYGICLLLFDFETVVYSLIYTTFISIFIDRVYIQNINVQAMIFTKSKGVTDRILNQLDRGVTAWNGWGAYTHEDSYILVTMISKYEIPQLLDLVHEVDPNAFIIVTEGTRIYGNFIKRLTD